MAQTVTSSPRMLVPAFPQSDVTCLEDNVTTVTSVDSFSVVGHGL